MARLTSHRFTRFIHPFFRVRLSRVPIYIIFISTLVSVYYLTANPSSHPALSHLDQHLREWRRYPNRAAGVGDGDGDEGGNNFVDQLEISDVDGLARGWQLVKGKRSKHPIEFLIEKGQERWKGLLARQSRTLEDAFAEYVRRYDRPPPKGFDVWWKYAKENNVQIVDDVSACKSRRC
jgi:hypothetical protein